MGYMISFQAFLLTSTGCLALARSTRVACQSPDLCYLRGSRAEWPASERGYSCLGTVKYSLLTKHSDEPPPPVTRTSGPRLNLSDGIPHGLQPETCSRLQTDRTWVGRKTPTHLFTLLCTSDCTSPVISCPSYFAHNRDA